MAGKPILLPLARSCGWCRELESSRCHQCHGLAVPGPAVPRPSKCPQEQRRSCSFEMPGVSAVCELLMRPRVLTPASFKVKKRTTLLFISFSPFWLLFRSVLSHIWCLVNPGVCLFFLLADAACSGTGTKGSDQEYVTFPLLVQQ